ncbi:phosphatase PAP2 family protein [Bacillus sp. T33-2]|uniref:phosphatase PAP2 family protein n=1 Tax=Bacillus sp. T33-2 TaxID=2054168 RepID=UPI000C76BA2B|nr:phosphatase PAP2 family protein [Bacillus sp. T33-2]PLR94043.1 phosphatase PAP2 family protein [Bacillus sp. T33-2]
MERTKAWISKYGESWFYTCNRWPDVYVDFFKWITHLGGARITISLQLVLFFFAPPSFQPAIIASGLALAVSHVIMAAIKKTVRRIRPYIALPDAKVHGHLFKDHSFPSGHSTAIFSLLVPYMVYSPGLIPVLFPAACLVAFSRVVLGVHYPSDVFAGALLGSVTAIAFCSL